MADIVYMAKTKWQALLNKIRAKGGTSSAMTVDQAITAVEAIPTGSTAVLVTKSITENGTYAASSDNADGYSSVVVNVAASGYSADDWLDSSKPTGEVMSNTAFGDYSATYRLYDRKGITKLTIPNATGLSESICQGCTGLTAIYAPKVKNVLINALRNTRIVYLVLPAALQFRQRCCGDNPSLLAADFGGTPGAGFAQGDVFTNCTNFNVLVLRSSTVWPLSNISVFSSTPFAAGKAGGTLYVPQASIANYQAATKWSTILGYSTNQILPIEGSIYETQYVDGTAIPTT